MATGLNGFIGSALVRGASPADPAWVPLEAAPRFELLKEDQIEAALDAAPDASAVLHLAAFTDTGRAHEQWGDREGSCYRINVLGTRHIARACARRGLHLIYASTDYVFAGEPEALYTEEDEPRPIDWYGETKYLGEIEARRAPAWTIVRLSFPYGEGKHPRDLRRKIRVMYERDGVLNLFRDQVITPTWQADIVDGLGLIAEALPRNEVIHLAGPEFTTPYDFGVAAAPGLGIPAEAVRPSEMPATEAGTSRPRHRSLRLDTTKWQDLARRHGRAAPLGLAEGLRRATEPGV